MHYFQELRFHLHRLFENPSFFVFPGRCNEILIVIWGCFECVALPVLDGLIATMQNECPAHGARRRDAFGKDCMNEFSGRGLPEGNLLPRWKVTPGSAHEGMLKN